VPHCNITVIVAELCVTTDPVYVFLILNVTVSGAPVVLMKLKLVQTCEPQLIFVLVVVPSPDSTATLEIMAQ